MREHREQPAVTATHRLWVAFVLALALGALGALALGGCSGGSKSSNKGFERDVQHVADLFARSDRGICDRASKAFLQRYFRGSLDACRKSADEDDAGDARATDVSIDGDRATARIVVKGSGSTLTLRRSGSRWLADSVKQGAGKSAPKPAPDDPAMRRSTAHGVVDAFLRATTDNDENVLCGLLTEAFARRIVGVPTAGVASCVDALRGKSFATLRGRFGRAKVEAVTLRSNAATVRLTNGVVLSLTADGEHFLIDRVRDG